MHMFYSSALNVHFNNSFNVFHKRKLRPIHIRARELLQMITPLYTKHKMH